MASKLDSMKWLQSFSHFTDFHKSFGSPGTEKYKKYFSRQSL